MDKVDEWLTEREEEWDRPLPERAGKVVFVGLVTLLASAFAEKAYDGYFKRRRLK